MNFRKWTRCFLIPVVVLAIAAAAAGCSSNSSSNTKTQITYKVQKGTIALNVTAVGNVDYSDEHELSFDASGTLYLSEVNVSVGDSVKKGDVLAKLDMTQYQQNVTSLQQTLTSKKVSLSQAQLSVTQAEQNVVSAQSGVTTAENNLATSQYDLTKAQKNLEQTKADAELTIANDELSLKQAQYAFDTNTGGTYASDKLALAKQQLANDQDKTQANIDDAQNSVTLAQNDVISKQAAITTAQDSVTNAQTSLDISNLSLTNAQQAVTDAQKSLDDANAASPEITSPIDGLVITVTSAGQEVYKGQTIVTVVDPNTFEVNVSVGESNIPDIEIGGAATIQFDALSGVTLDGKIASIAPTSTTSQGVVSYAVTVDVVSLTNKTAGVATGTGGQSSTFTGTIPSGQMPSGTPPSGLTGQGFTPPAGAATTTNAAATSNSGSQVQLRQGMTATVTITYESATNVLVVPNAAITRTGSTATTVNVQVNGVATEKTIQTGLSNSTMTQVTGGISEGDELVYYRTSSSSSSSSGGGGGGIGGLGGGGGVVIR